MVKNIHIKRGQKWQKRRSVHPKPFYGIVVGKGKHDGWKLACTDGDTHTIAKDVLLSFFELIE